MSMTLFISSNSKACMPVLDIIYQHRLPIQIVRLDTEHTRRMAATGRYFQINIVPSMVVAREDGNIQLFVGADKIMGLLSANFMRPHPKENMYTTDYAKPSKPAIQPYPSHPKKVVIYDDDDVDADADDYGSDRDDEVTIIPTDDFEGESTTSSTKSILRKPSKMVIEDDDVVDEVIEEEPNIELEDTKKKPRKKAKAKSKRKGEIPPKAKGKRVSFVEEGQLDPPLTEDAGTEVTKKVGRSKGSSNPMQNIINKAKKMEAERLDSLGYEDDPS